MDEKLYKQYLAERKRSEFYNVTAAEALKSIKYKKQVALWMYNLGIPLFYGDQEYIDENGYRYLFKVEDDYMDRNDDIDHQGYKIDKGVRYPTERFEVGQWCRTAGFGMEALLDVDLSARRYRSTYWLFDLPNSFVIQFRDQKNYSRHESYVRMLAQAKNAVENDIKYLLNGSYHVISVTLYDPDGKELSSDSLGGCDEDYVTSGEAFYEHGMFETLQKVAAEDWAKRNPEEVAENYMEGAFI